MNIGKNFFRRTFVNKNRRFVYKFPWLDEEIVNFLCRTRVMKWFSRYFHSVAWRGNVIAKSTVKTKVRSLLIFVAELISLNLIENLSFRIQCASIEELFYLIMRISLKMNLRSLNRLWKRRKNCHDIQIDFIRQLIRSNGVWHDSLIDTFVSNQPNRWGWVRVRVDWGWNFTQIIIKCNCR